MFTEHGNGQRTDCRHRDCYTRKWTDRRDVVDTRCVSQTNESYRCPVCVNTGREILGEGEKIANGSKAGATVCLWCLSVGFIAVIQIFALGVRRESGKSRVATKARECH